MPVPRNCHWRGASPPVAPRRQRVWAPHRPVRKMSHSMSPEPTCPCVNFATGRSDRLAFGPRSPHSGMPLARGSARGRKSQERFRFFDSRAPSLSYIRSGISSGNQELVRHNPVRNDEVFPGRAKDIRPGPYVGPTGEITEGAVLGPNVRFATRSSLGVVAGGKSRPTERPPPHPGLILAYFGL